MDKLRYMLHGIPFDLYQKEYGLYLMAEGVNLQYQVIKPHQFVRGINNLPREEAIKMVTTLRDNARQQIEWRSAGSYGFEGNRVTPVAQVKDKIRNTRDLAQQVLEILEKK